MNARHNLARRLGTATDGLRIKTIEYPGIATKTENFHGTSRRVLRQTSRLGETRFAYINGVRHHNHKKPITGFHQDKENHWVAELECGHFQHMRHDPPWISRPWVVSPDGRESMIGQALQCKKCDEGAPLDRL